MQSDCEVYVDPDEDEVFFGRVSEKEKTICSKLVKYEGSTPKQNLKSSKILHDSTTLIEDEAVFSNKLISEEASQLSQKLSDTPISHSPDLVKHDNLKKSIFEDDVSVKTTSDNSSVELEHNYSTPMKHRIDKSILTTPKSVVKADKDGGFLKVLSEIALVKAEAEGDKNSMEDEDKENMKIPSIPEIKITEATPEKAAIISPPKSSNSEWRRFRIIYNSPQNENNIDCDSKSRTETVESEQKFENKRSNEDVEKFSVNGKEKSIDLIDLTDFTEAGDVKESFSPERETAIQTESGTANEENCKGSDVALSKKLVYCGTTPSESSKCSHREATKEPFPEIGNFQLSQSAPGGGIPRNAVRFSKEARKIVEVLKKSSAIDDTLNSTIPELNLEEEENSFLSPDPVSIFDDTVVPREKLEIQRPESKSSSCQSTPKVTTEPNVKAQTKSKTTEKDRCKLTPSVTQSRPRPIKYFSERRFYGENRSEDKKRCTKRLPFEENKSATVEKLRGGASETKTAPLSRIPVFGMKNSKLPSTDRNARPLTAKVTPSKSPLIRTQKNPKFNHIESPINAYIHNKPTSLVLNVKPEVKKDSLTKVWKAQTAGESKKVEEKVQKAQKCDGAGVRLPFVEYESTTPYKIEKRPESRLPRLAPTVMKLIGSHSPRVLKHEGRFYVNSPRKQSATENGTIVADANEVSVLVCRPVQKSNTIK